MVVGESRNCVGSFSNWRSFLRRFALNLILLEKVLEREDIQNGLKSVFGRLHAGDSKR